MGGATRRPDRRRRARTTGWIEDRDADIWEPLIAIADAAGGDWPKRAREAAVYLTDRAADETLTKGVELLAHIFEAFGGADKLWRDVLIERLVARDESPWKDIYGKSIDGRGLAVRLKPYGIRSKTVRVGDRTAKGYDAADFSDAWDRYLPDKRHKRHKCHIIDNENKVVTDVTDVTADDAFEERAAILEFDGGLSREEAENQAANDMEIPAFLRRSA